MPRQAVANTRLEVFLPLNDTSGYSARDYSGKSSSYATSMNYLAGTVAWTGQTAHFMGSGYYPYSGVSLASVQLDYPVSFTFSGFFALDHVVSRLRLQGL